MEPITIGASGTASVTVDMSNLAMTVGSGSLPVFATPMMASLMEQAACNAVAPFLAEGETTVGTKLEISHDAATPPGLTVTATAEVTAVSGREISFHVTAEDGVSIIGSGTHKRFLVDAERFTLKARKRGE
ncbi:thioesterase family protein [uncultured Ruminococcus sp.]|uniref:thioesterase family protein n=1 Tax=uncultured Ruminococcus sp. TaxID=165186 RepID=UPI002613D9E5|nr:thioesterase family protein [uncultured Ruminococcus sp.]